MKRQVIEVLKTGVASTDLLASDLHILVNETQDATPVVVPTVPSLQDVSNVGATTTTLLTAAGFKLPHGLPTEYLKADGTVEALQLAINYTSYGSYIGINSGPNGDGTNTSTVDGIMIGSNAGFGVTTQNTSSIFLGNNAGRLADSSYFSYFLGSSAGVLANDSYFSTFIGNNAGYAAHHSPTSTFIGNSSGAYANNAYNSVFLGGYSGLAADGSYESVLIGSYAGATDNHGKLGHQNIIIGNKVSLPAGTSNALNIGGVLFGVNISTPFETEEGVTVTRIADPNARLGVGIVTPHQSALLDLTSSNKGLLVPRMSTVQRSNIANPAVGLIIYNTSSNLFNFYNGTAWTELNAGAVTINEANLVHLTGTESITGAKTFTADFKSKSILDNGKLLVYNITGRSGSDITHPVPFITLKNDDSETPNPGAGAMISGSARGGAIVFDSNFGTSGNHALKLGSIDNNQVFTEKIRISDGDLWTQAYQPFQYSQDMSASFNDRTLVDKAYVDSRVAGFSTGTPTLQAVATAGSTTTTQLTAAGFKVPSGTSLGFLKADGSIDTNAYLTSVNETNLVHLSGTETITGSKTFSSSVRGLTEATTDNSTKLASTAFVRSREALLQAQLDAMQNQISSLLTKIKVNLYQSNL